MPGPRDNRRAALAGTVTTVLLTAVLLGRSLGHGTLLYRDFVSVPHPLWNPSVTGQDGLPPRAVPLDALTVLLSGVVPSGIQQQVMLVATLVLAGSGMAVLLRRHGAIAAVTGAAVMVWNPYAGERLLVGQPPVLLAWSMTPWLVAAARAGGEPRRWAGRILLAALPAALTPFGGIWAAAAAGGAALTRPEHRTRRHLLLLALTAGVWCSPWLLALALTGEGVAADPQGAIAFAIRLPETNSLLAVLGVLSGGGVWSQGAALDSRRAIPALLASLALLGMAWLGLRRIRHRRTALALALGLPLAAVTLSQGWGLGLAGWAQQLPGVALARDTHRLLGLSSFVVATLVGLGAAHLRLPRAAAVVAVSLTVLSAPDLPARLHAAYRPTAFPVEWDQMVEQVGDRTTLVLPWQPLRRQSWASGPFLDPTAAAIRGKAVRSRTLTVQRDSTILKVDSGSDDPVAAELSGASNLTADALRRAHIGAVVEWRSSPGHLPSRHDGLALVLDGPTLRVWTVPGV